MNTHIRPILMTPLRRCGSHALRLRLAFSSEIYSPYPLHVVDLKPLLPLYGDLNDDRRYFQLITDLIGLQTESLVKWPDVAFDARQILALVEGKPRSIHTVAMEMLFQAARKNSASIAMDKSLDNIHDWPELIQLYPDILFLRVVRDPRAQISSMNRSIIYDFDSLLNAQTWVRAFTAAKELNQAHPEKVLTVRFEDFIHDEANTIAKICSFMGLKFFPGMLDVSQSEEARRISTQSSLWESNSSAPIPANIDKFKKTLSDSEIEMIETLTGSFMDEFGYSRLTPARTQVTEKLLEEARSNSAELKAKAWNEIKTTRPQDYILRRRRADFIEMCRRNLASF